MQDGSSAMNAPLKAVAGSGNLEATHARDRPRSAQGRAPRWRSPRQRKRTEPLAAMAKAIRGSRPRSSPPMRTTGRRRSPPAPPRPSSTGSRSTPSGSRRWRPGSTPSASSKIRSAPSWRAWRRPNGMRIERVRVPLGVVGVIYESRPNVTADAGALCLKAGNAAILRGGSESFRSCHAIHAALVEGLVEAGLPAHGDRAHSDARPRGRRHDACRSRRRDRRDRAARRQRPGRTGADRGARAGLCPSRRRLPRLCRRQGQARHGQIDRAQCQNAPHRRVRSGRDLAGGSRGGGKAPQAARHHAARRRLRDPRRRRPSKPSTAG